MPVLALGTAPLCWVPWAASSASLSYSGNEVYGIELILGVKGPMASGFFYVKMSGPSSLLAGGCAEGC